LVLDEPFAELDDQGRETLTGVLEHLRSAAGLTLVIVSHDREPALRIVNRVVALDAGRLVAERACGLDPRAPDQVDHVR
jgi:ABC-type sulfate/molybdate transport systems ATPase subunit